MKVDEWLGKETDKVNNIRLESVKDIIHQKNAALVLGSGISIPAGLPSWNALMAKCIGMMMQMELWGPEESYRKDFKTFKDSGILFDTLYNYLSQGKGDLGISTNLLELGQYLKQVGPNKGLPNDDFVSEMMVCELVKHSTIPTKTPDKILTSTVGKCADLMSSSLIDIAVTYNFDTLLEYCIRKKDESKKIKIEIYADNSKLPYISVPENTVQIFHVHGCAPTPGFETECPTSNLVFTEDSYWNEEQDVYSWSNSIQSLLLQNKTCLFIGFSTQDPNFRRLLQRWKPHVKKESKHYLFLPLQDIDKEICNMFDTTSPTESKLKKVLLNYMLLLKEVYWRDYGIYPIWTSYEELPTMLENLKST